MSVTPLHRPLPLKGRVPDQLPGRVAPPRPAAVEPLQPKRDKRHLGQILLDEGAVEAGNLFKAVVIQQREQAALGEILLANGWVTEQALARALSRQWRTTTVNFDSHAPDARLIDQAGADFCLTHGLVPWRRVGGLTFVAAAYPERFEELRGPLTAALGPVRMMLCAPSEARDAVLSRRQTQLVRQAERRVPAELSCRTRNEIRTGQIAVALMGAVALALWLAPVAMLIGLTALAVTMLIASMALKLLSFRAVLRRRSAAEAPAEFRGRLPVISVMVPLFRESDIADRLVGRLSRLTYPRELTDILLVVEESDPQTRAALAAAELPRWMRVVTVPDGPVKTKPRALNYALNFCRGSIIGIWDAEDRPEPDQLHKVARRFAAAPAEVACLQGILDYYNPRTNWLARCFTIEYAAWFRTNLPGVERLGLVVPLGGTTLFFRRPLLEQVGGWDAWNVTEDCDLGVRLARHGLRTEMLDTVTHEEANCRPVQWVKQRSRWLKGFLMTWGVHMRDPARLRREIGTTAFVAMQVQVLFSVCQYLFAPVLWSFWLMAVGGSHPVMDHLAASGWGWVGPALVTLFVASELLNMTVAAWAVRGPEHRHLLKWVPTMHLYFPLGCLAGWKAVYEIVVNPFYWDKTMHGVFDSAASEVPEAPAAPVPVNVALPGDRVLPVRGTLDLAAHAAPVAPAAVPTGADAEDEDLFAPVAATEAVAQQAG